jgi:hypothetical protein
MTIWTGCSAVRLGKTKFPAAILPMAISVKKLIILEIVFHKVRPW